MHRAEREAGGPTLRCAPATDDDPELLALPDQLEALLHWIRTAATRLGPTVVCIAGGTSTGKSTQITASLARALGSETRVLAQDMQQCTPRAPLDPRYGFDHPEIYGIDACLAAIERFRSGTAFDWPRFDFVQRSHGAPLRVEPGDWLIIEGLHALATPLAAAADIGLYAEAPAVVRLVRRILRNQYERYPGLATPARTAAGFFGPVLTAHRELVRPQRDSAHLRVQTDRDFSQLRVRFGLEATGFEVNDDLETGRRVDFDDKTIVRCVRDATGSWRLRIDVGGARYADWEVDAKTAEGFASFDPEET